MATNKEYMLLQNMWAKYQSGLQRGHEKYSKQAKYLENMYLGGGRQWTATEEDKDVVAELEAAGKPILELNLINSSIRTILGYQTQSRMNIAYQPRESGDLKTAEILTKIALYELDQNRFPWIESQVFEDGIVQQRGYFDIRMDYEEDLNGRIKIEAKDPLDIMPDPDAKSYDPKSWNYVIETKWVSLSDLKALYPSKYRRVYETALNSEQDWGESGESAPRNHFGDVLYTNNYYKQSEDEIYVRVLEMQHIKVVRRDYFYSPEDSSLVPVPDYMTKPQAKKEAKATGREILPRVTKRIRYTISTEHVVLHDDWSPYDHYTIVPYFPIFRRGITLGLVDNLVSNQEMMNKVYSQILHIVNTTANSGWLVEENSLINMDVEDLEAEGAATGLVVEYKRGSTKPEKIQPNQIPSGLKDLFNTSRDLHDQVLGVSESFRGEATNEVSGQAIQSRVAQTGVGLTSVIDNLFYTRNLVATILLNLIQNFYTEERTFRILSDSYTNEGEDEVEEITINQQTEDVDPETGEIVSEILNDTTLGKYDIVISDVPTQVTYLDAQLKQALEMRKYGINIPDHRIVKLTTLTDRDDIAKEMSGEANEQQQLAMQAEMEKLQAENDKLRAEASNKDSASLKNAADIAATLSESPGLIDIFYNIVEYQKQQQMETSSGPPQNIQPQQDSLGNFF
jgi:hypothetical protein